MWFLAACTPTSTRLTVHPEAERVDVFRDFVAFAGAPGLSLDTGEPVGPGRHVVLRADPALGRGAYRVAVDGRVVTVTGGDVLGQQFGLADVLESAGVRFVHPDYTLAPVELRPREDWPTDPIVPEVARNGLHLHTLHPIEAYYDLWEPGDALLARAERVVDWLVKNRGDHLQWPLLDQILTDPAALPAWRDHTAAIIGYAHARGVTVGLGVQLFSGSNLQHAFDLVQGDVADPVEIDRRLDALAGLRLDEIDLSFGEFTGEEPEVFLAAGDLAVERIRARWPAAQVASTIHVGGDQRVTWQGEEMGYYFLAQFLDGVVPRPHTVMYYDLFEDAGGAYEVDSFAEHRDFLLRRLSEGEPVGYHPESAYWVAFDNPVPTFLPLYAKSRFIDLDGIALAGVGQLQDHVLFSSGWEWGYWLNDVVTLRMAHHRPARWEEPVHFVFSGWGEDGRILADAVVALGELQHDALIEQRLAAYLAGRDTIIDLGDDALDIHSQPDRPQFDEIAGLSPGERAELELVVQRLDDLGAQTEALRSTIVGLGVEDPVFEEMRDGFAIDALRARFAARVFGSALAFARTGDGEADLAEAERILADARAVVAARHARAWWAGGDAIFVENANATLYQSGYLYKADTLCFWDRERIQVSNLIRGATEPVPPCT